MFEYSGAGLEIFRILKERIYRDNDTLLRTHSLEDSQPALFVFDYR